MPYYNKTWISEAIPQIGDDSFRIWVSEKQLRNMCCFVHICKRGSRILHFREMRRYAVQIVAN
jgi:hypothetical protein